MKAEYSGGNVKATCPTCKAVTTFEYRDATREFGNVLKDGPVATDPNRVPYARTVYMLLRCAGCWRGGMATVAANNSVAAGTLVDFVPRCPERAKIPAGVPEGIAKELREAEDCAATPALRAASGMLRSVLEKALLDSGYTNGKLFQKIELAAQDGVITEARRRKAQEDVRALGNDVLHEPWREVTADEVETAHHYAQRILEDLYDDRLAVEKILKAKGRLPP